MLNLGGGTNWLMKNPYIWLIIILISLGSVIPLGSQFAIYITSRTCIVFTKNWRKFSKNSQTLINSPNFFGGEKTSHPQPRRLEQSLLLLAKPHLFLRLAGAAQMGFRHLGDFRQAPMHVLGRWKRLGAKRGSTTGWIFQKGWDTDPPGGGWIHKAVVKKIRGGQNSWRFCFHIFCFQGGGWFKRP